MGDVLPTPVAAGLLGYLADGGLGALEPDRIADHPALFLREEGTCLLRNAVTLARVARRQPRQNALQSSVVARAEPCTVRRGRVTATAQARDPLRAEPSALEPSILYRCGLRGLLRRCGLAGLASLGRHGVAPLCGVTFGPVLGSLPT